MNVYTREQIREYDRRAIEETKISGLVLMENAALRVLEFLEAKFSPLETKKIIILCGKGNNGGDGLALARLLESYGFARTLTFLAANPEDLRGDALANYQILRASGHPVTLLESPFSPEAVHLLRWAHSEREIIVVDALLGTGFSGELGPIYHEIVRHLPHTPRPCFVAVDLPSGLDCDSGEFGNVRSQSFRADFTVSFAGAKPGFFVRDGLEACGEIWIGEVGAPSIVHELLNETGAPIAWTFGITEAKKFLPQRAVDAHKGDAGRVLVVGGSLGMSGAIALAAKSALGVGAGLCTAAIPEKILAPFATSILEATSIGLPCDEAGSLRESAIEKLPELWENADAVALGPGLSRSPEAQNFARRVALECPKPLIIDADALHALPTIAEEMRRRTLPTILTPHPGEAGVLLGVSAREINDDRLSSVQKLAEKYGAIVVLKGARTLIGAPRGWPHPWRKNMASPGHTSRGAINHNSLDFPSVNLSGNAGMATGGSGDVLTGTIAGLLAQTKNAEGAALFGVYLHGFAGDLAFAEKGNGLVAGDISAHLGAALVEIPRRKVEIINGRLQKLE